MNLLKALDVKRMSKNRISDIAYKILERDGGEGSGNFNHQGRPGQVGGSGGGGSGGKSSFRADSGTQKQHKNAVDRLSGNDYSDGTYSISSMKPVEHDKGYQVTFCQIGDNYSVEEYADKVNEFIDASDDGECYAGKFEGTPEISFHLSSREEAERLARKYNQISIWDWENAEPIETQGTGRRD